MKEFLFEDKTENILDLIPDSKVEVCYLLININLCGMPGQTMAKELAAREYVKRNLKDIERRNKRATRCKRNETK